jgi:DNA-binding transcriptional ArsR family regulator
MPRVTPIPLHLTGTRLDPLGYSIFGMLNIYKAVEMNGYKKVASLMKALSHPTRLQILETLRKEGEACVCHLEHRLGQRQAYISQQLAKLREVDLVSDRRDGLNVYYAAADDGIDDLIQDARNLAVAIAQRDGVVLEFEAQRSIDADPCSCPRCEKEPIVSQTN